MAPTTRKRARSPVEAAATDVTSDGFDSGDQEQSHQLINDALKESQKQSNPEKSNTRSPMDRAAPKISRPIARPINLSQLKRPLSGSTGLQADHDPEAPSTIDVEDGGPPLKRAKLSQTTTRAGTSSVSIKLPTRKSDRIQGGRKSSGPSNKPRAPHQKEESQTLPTEPNIADQAEDLLRSNTLKSPKDHPRKRRSQLLSAVHKANSDEDSDAQGDVRSDDPAEDANTDDPRDARGIPRTLEDGIIGTQVFYTMRAILKEGISSLEDDRKKIEWINKPAEEMRGNKRIVIDLIAELGHIQSNYVDLRKFKVSGKTRLTRTAEIKASNSSKVVVSQVERLQMRPALILDAVYLHVIPNFIDAITQGVDAHTSTEPISTATLEEIQLLLSSVHLLAKKAVTPPGKRGPENMHLQPLGQAVITILPMIRKAKKNFATLKTTLESQFRESQEQIDAENTREAKQEAERRKEMDLIFAEQAKVEEERKERIRHLKDLEERKEKGARLNALHKRQWQALNAKLADRLLSTSFTVQPARHDDRPIVWMREGGHGKQNLDSTRSAHPLATLDYEELARSGRYAGHDPTQAKLPSNREEHPFARQPKEAKIAFVDIMRSEPGPDRYATASEKLGWTMDEVFECARDLQQAMDIEHENGNMNQPCDEWTYSIWTDQGIRGSVPV